MALESEFQALVLKYLEKHGYYAVKIITCSRSGWMDIVACSPTGRFVGIELKAGDNQPDDLQKVHIQEVLKRGGIAFTAWTMAHIKEGLDFGYRAGSELKKAPPLL